MRGRATPRDMLLLLGVNVLWGSTYVVARHALETTPPLILAFLRCLLAAICMLLLDRLLHRTRVHPPLSPAPKVLPWVLPATGICGFGIAKLLSYEGLLRSTATDAALIINLEAVFTAWFAVLCLGQRLMLREWSGVVLAFVGGVLLLLPAGGSGADGGRLFGNMLLIGSVAAEAASSVLGARAALQFSGWQITARSIYWGTAFLLPCAVWQWGRTGYDLSWCSPGFLSAVTYLAIGATVLGYVIWFQVLERVDAGRVGVFLYVQPVVGVLLGITLRQEWPTTWGIAGSGLVLLGIWLVSRRCPNATDAAAPV